MQTVLKDPLGGPVKSVAGRAIFYNLIAVANDTKDFVRASAAWAWGSDQLLDEYAADELRRDYDPATGAFRGVLVEQDATNIFQYSDALERSQWRKGGVTIDASGSIRKLVEDSSTGTHRIFDSPVGDQTDPWTISALVSPNGRSQFRLTINFAENPAADASADFDADTLSVSGVSKGTDTTGPSAEIYSVGGGEYRVSLSVEQGNVTDDGNVVALLYLLDSGGNNSYTGDGASGAWVRKMQLEPSPFNTSLITSTGTATTRAADVLEGAFSESSGTIHIVGEHKGGDGVLWQADDGTSGNRLRLEVSGGDIQLVVDDGGVNQATLNAGALASDGTYNVAFHFDGSDFAISLDGAAAVTQASGTMPTLTTNRFGRDTTGTKKINWYKIAEYSEDIVSTAELEALTS